MEDFNVNTNIKTIFNYYSYIYLNLIGRQQTSICSYYFYKLKKPQILQVSGNHGTLSLTAPTIFKHYCSL